MSELSLEASIISHEVNPERLTSLLDEKMKAIIEAHGKESNFTHECLAILEQLSQFDFGRFLLQNRGINGYWTHYMLTHPYKKNPIYANSLEKFLLTQSPSIMATQERFNIFLKENQKSVKNNAKLACIPCGMMGELFYLDFNNIENISLRGLDFDVHTLEDAKKLAKKRDLLKWGQFEHGDAWSMNIEDQFDLISSNGLNIYEPDDERVTKLYDKFYKALKVGGKLVTSFLTPPPNLSDTCEWNMSKVSIEDLNKQKIIFSDILQVKWQCYRKTEQTREQLISVGFSDICFYPDKVNIFPTVVAFKK